MGLASGEGAQSGAPSLASAQAVVPASQVRGSSIPCGGLVNSLRLCEAQVFFLRSPWLGTFFSAPRVGCRKGKDLPLECSGAHFIDTGTGKLFFIGMAGDAVVSPRVGYKLTSTCVHQAVAMLCYGLH